MDAYSPQPPAAIPGAAGPGRGSGNARVNIEIRERWSPEEIVAPAHFSPSTGQGGMGTAMLYGTDVHGGAMLYG